MKDYTINMSGKSVISARVLLGTSVETDYHDPSVDDVTLFPNDHTFPRNLTKLHDHILGILPRFSLPNLVILLWREESF